MSSLLHTALANRQAASHPSPSKRFARLAVDQGDDAHVEDGEFVNEFDDDDDDDDDEDELVDLQTRPGTPVPGGARSAGLPAKVSSKQSTRDPVRFCSVRRPSFPAPSLTSLFPLVISFVSFRPRWPSGFFCSSISRVSRGVIGSASDGGRARR